MAAFEWGGSYEYRYIKNLILTTALAVGYVHSDMIYEMLSGEFSGHPNRMPAAFHTLSQQGLIEKTVPFFSKRRIARNYKFIWKLTPAGHALFQPEMGKA